MIIDLREYSKEVVGYTRTAKSLVERASQSALEKVALDLETGQDTQDHFYWNTPKAIRTIETRDYDRAGQSAPPVYVEWGFRAEFTRQPAPRRNAKWRIDELTTQFKVWAARDTTRPALVFHIDRKSPGQFGPDFHMQVSEDYTASAGPLHLAVPRFPTHCLLPTDCLDLVLSEFFQQKWLKEQSEGPINLMRSAQLTRAKLYSEAIAGMWQAKPRSTPISALQNFPLPSLNLSHESR
ncbi:hypothetical protein [Methylocystis sp. JR02]|uniref:hypothetical protein n=1 Tax=Methylocystis sp. JR02 TaxID=3046284 RepID=UPI0024BADF8D|nr:hypothetical protein [Methylocystis sp. JR02]MDJ0449261.1 hypothetical protein [Methylocystis sp. JR02]